MSDSIEWFDVEQFRHGSARESADLGDRPELAKHLDSLLRAWRWAGEEGGEEGLLGSMTELLCGAFRADGTAVVRCDPESGTWCVLAGRGAHADTVEPDAPTRSLVAEVLDRGAAAAARTPSRAVLCTPLATQGDAVEAVYAERHDPDRPFSQADLQGFAVLVREFAAALRQVRERARLARDNDRLQALVEVAEVLGSARSSKSLLEQIARDAARLLHADRASIFLWDKRRHELIGLPAIGVDELRVPDSAGVVGPVAKTGETLRVHRPYEDPRFDRGVDQQTGYRTESLMCAPLVNPSGERIGVFEVINKQQGAFTREDERALSSFLTLAATALGNTQERERLAQANRSWVDAAAGQMQILGESPAIQQVRETIDRVAQTDLPVLVLGESGTGKELVANAVHCRSSRREHPLIVVNCAALPETLLESELFGHERGAFTGAEQMRQGKFERADKGTLFLDEIAEMSVGAQAKLLRVLEEKLVYRVGGSTAIPCDARVIAATNRDLAASVPRGEFRMDLYYRLDVLAIHLPPLRDRPEDIPLLVEHFLDRAARETAFPKVKLAPDAIQRLCQYYWPGNIRELRNATERLTFLCPGPVIHAAQLDAILQSDLVRGPEAQDADADTTLAEATAEFQRESIRRAIERSGHNVAQAAQALGMPRGNLYRKMKQLGMQYPPQ